MKALDPRALTRTDGGGTASLAPRIDDLIISTLNDGLTRVHSDRAKLVACLQVRESFSRSVSENDGLRASAIAT